MILRCRQLAPHEIALQVDIAGAPIEVTPLEREELAGAHASAQAAHEPGIPIRELATRGVEHEIDFLTRERADFRFGSVGVTEVLSEPESRVRDEELVVNGLRQNRAQRARNSADRR